MDLQLTWFILITVLLTGYAVLDGFDLGVGVLYTFIGRNEGQRAALRTSIGPVWDGNEVWLITGGGALFAAFPPVYAMTFSGFYLAIMLVLFGLILRAVSLEFGHHDESWRSFWDVAFFLGSALPALLFGVAVGNVVRGVPLDAAGDYAGSFWGLLNPYALGAGVLGIVMLMAHGAAWTALKNDGVLRLRAHTALSGLHVAFLVALAGMTLYTALAVPERIENVLARPLGWLALAVLVVSIVWTRLTLRRKHDLQTFLAMASTIASIMAIVAVGNYPALIPARGTPAATSLTVSNAAASDHALAVMAIITCIGLPLVFSYTAWVYKTFKGRVHPGIAEY